MTLPTAFRTSVCFLFAGLSVLAGSLTGCGDDDDGPPPVLRILVTNDDGVEAEGIDAIVEALIADPNNEILISAPAGNRSGSSDMMGPSDFCGDLAVTSATTQSGRAATAVNGCPADAVVYGLGQLYPADEPPHLVVSGINEGQNISAVIAGLSGTVGAAKTAARLGVPALASSQGIPEPDYPSGVEQVLDWISENRNNLIAGFVPDSIISINIPSCLSGTLRGAIDVSLAPDAAGAFDEPDCNSQLTDPADDVEAFQNGYASRTVVGLD